MSTSDRGAAGLHVGVVCRTDVDSGIDLASALLLAGGTRVSLYLTRRHTTMALGETEDLAGRLYELGLLPAACRVRIRDIPRMRDPRSLATVRRLARTLRDDGVDLVHILIGPGELWLAVLARLLGDIPVVSTMVIPKPNVGEDLPDWLVLAVHRLLASGSQVVVVNGQNQVDLVRDIYHLPAGRVAYVPLCPRTTAVGWAGSPSLEEPGTVLFFGAARRSKGLEILVKAQPRLSQQVRGARILISSRGEELERCRAMIQDSTHFEIHDGFVPGNVMADLFQRACVVALPYLSASTSGVLLTAYGFGKPVVATRVGCLPEYVRDGETGFLVPPGDPDELAAALAGLLTDDGLRHRMGHNASRWIEARQKEVALATQRVYDRAVHLYAQGVLP